MDEIEEAQNILMKWLMSDHTGKEVTVAEMHKVKKLIGQLQTDKKRLKKQRDMMSKVCAMYIDGLNQLATKIKQTLEQALKE